MTRIAVVIPVGPERHHCQYLTEALVSLTHQTRRPDEIVLLDDMHGLDGRDHGHLIPQERPIPIEYRPPWRLGVGHAFNHGVAIAFHRGADLAVMMGADDKLFPQTIERLEETYRAQQGRQGYYWFDTEYESGQLQQVPCNNAAATPGFWTRTGGLPVEASSGGMDAALISSMLVHDPDSLIHVKGHDRARFWARQHSQQESTRLNAFDAANAIIRNVITDQYRPTRWGRYIDPYQ